MASKKPPTFKYLPDQPYSIQDRTGTAIPSVTRLLDRKSILNSGAQTKLEAGSTESWSVSSPRTPEEIALALGQEWRSYSNLIEELRHHCEQTGAVCAIFVTLAQADLHQSKVVLGLDSWIATGLRSVALTGPATQPEINPWLLGLPNQRKINTRPFTSNGKTHGFALIVEAA